MTEKRFKPCPACGSTEHRRGWVQIPTGKIIDGKLQYEEVLVDECLYCSTEVEEEK